MSYVDSLYAGDFVGYAGYEGEYLDLAGFKKSVTIFSEMFSRFEIKIEDIVAERDVVSTRESWKVVRASDNKKMIGETMHWFRIKDGKITEEWSKGWEWLGPVTITN